MRTISFIIITGLFVSIISGCSIPAGTKWHKEDTSVAVIDGNVSECRVNTALWWPFDTLSNCMTRRGFRLVGADEYVTKR